MVAGAMYNACMYAHAHNIMAEMLHAYHTTNNITVLKMTVTVCVFET